MYSSNGRETVLVALDGFRAAFTRLKNGEPHILPSGTPVTQNNVAREAGRDPSALRKSRYPDLVREIQTYVAKIKVSCGDNNVRTEGRRSMSADEKMSRIKSERDEAMSILLEADVKILQLTIELEKYRAMSKP